MWSPTEFAVLACFMASIPLSAAELHCPVSAYAEIGNYAVLNCSLEAFHNLYWYKDTSTGTSPIVKIENNKKYILERTGHFNISDDGSLLIRDIKGEHLGRYEIIHFRRDNEIEKSNVKLKLAKKPSKRCPQIADCAKCDECTLVMKVGNDVSCTSLESRPLINVTLNVLGDNGSTFTDPLGTVYYNNVSDTWSTSSTIHVKSPNCSRSFNLTCSVEGNNLFYLSYSFAVIRVDSDECSATKPDKENESDGPHIFIVFKRFFMQILIVGTVLVALLCICILVVCVYTKRTDDNTNRRHNDNVEVELTTKPLLNVEGENTENTTISKDLEKMTDHLIQCLKDEYNTLSFIKPLPWGREIHIKHVYTASSFDVITPKESCSVSSTEFLESSDQDTMKRVIFIAALGHGKSTLQQYLAWKWSEKSKESKNERLLFFLHAKGIDINKGIAEALYSKLPADLQQILRVEDLAYILTNRKCRIVIDGLDEIAPNTEEKEKYNVLTPGDIQIRGLLQNSNLDDYRDMQLWVTSRELDNANAHFFPPFTEIHMRALTTQQLENYVEKVCKFYLSSAQVAKSEDFGKNHATVYSKNRENNDKLPSNRDPNNIEPDVATQKAAVKMHLEDIEFLQEFSKFPLLMTMFVHIIASEAICAGPKEFNIDINSFSSLVNAAKACLIRRYLQKPNNTAERTSIEFIEKRLGMLSLNHDKLNSCWHSSQLEDTLSADEMNTALAIGLLQRKNSKRDVSNLAYSSLNSVEFYHPYIQELIIAQYLTSSSQDMLPIVFEMLTKNAPESNRIARVLQLICGTSGDEARSVLKFLANKGLWDVLVDCYYEVSEEAKQTSFKVIKEHLSRSSNIDIDKLERRYHKKAAKAFCEICKTNKVSIKCMSFRYSDGHLKMVPDDFTKQITLPKMKQILFVEMSIGSDDTLIALIQMANDHAIKTLGFQNCSFPSNIETPGKLQALNKSITVEVLKINSDSETEEVLDFKKGKWKLYV